LTFFTGTTSAGASGSIALSTGDATGGKAGDFVLSVGTGSATAGATLLPPQGLAPLIQVDRLA
jgi:hypothetical protein